MQVKLRCELAAHGLTRHICKSLCMNSLTPRTAIKAISMSITQPLLPTGALQTKTRSAMTMLPLMLPTAQTEPTHTRYLRTPSISVMCVSMTPKPSRTERKSVYSMWKPHSLHSKSNSLSRTHLRNGYSEMHTGGKPLLSCTTSVSIP